MIVFKLHIKNILIIILIINLNCQNIYLTQIEIIHRVSDHTEPRPPRTNIKLKI